MGRGRDGTLIPRGGMKGGRIQPRYQGTAVTDNHPTATIGGAAAPECPPPHKKSIHRFVRYFPGYFLEIRIRKGIHLDLDTWIDVF